MSGPTRAPSFDLWLEPPSDAEQRTCQACEGGDIVWSKAHQAYRCPECGTEEVDD